MNKFTILTTALFCLALTPFACDATEGEPDPISPRLLKGQAEVSLGTESPEFVGKMLGCFVDPLPAAATIIEYRDDEPVDAVMIQTVEVCFATHAHVSVGACLRDAMIEAGGQVLP